MTIQTELFDVCKRKIKNHLTSTQYVRFYEILSRTEGATVDELSVILGMNPNAISGRITELRKKGKIEKQGTRKTRSGCNAVVWKSVRQRHIQSRL